MGYGVLENAPGAPEALAVFALRLHKHVVVELGPPQLAATPKHVRPRNVLQGFHIIEGDSDSDGGEGATEG